MCKMFTLNNISTFLRYYVSGSCNQNYYYDFCNLSLGLCEAGADYNDTILSCRLSVDECFNIFLPMDGDIIIKMEPLPKAIYLLFLRHPTGILLKNIVDYREELEYIYRKVSGRKNPTVIRRILDDVTNPLSNTLHKNLSIIRASFLKILPSEDAQLFIPIRNRGHKQYVLLDTSRIKLPENLH